MKNNPAIELKFDRSATSAIRALLDKATNVSFAVAYWGDSSADLFKDYTGNARILCNLDSGACCPDEVEKLIKRFGWKNVKNHRALHAKVYVGENAFLVGSSNVSTNGLALGEAQAAGLREANLEVTGVLLEQMNNWFNQRFNEAFKIMPEDMERARECWKLRRAMRDDASINRRPKRTLFEDLVRDPAIFKDKPIVIALTDKKWWNANGERHEEEKSQLARKERDGDLDFYEDWDIAPGTTVLDFAFGNRSCEFWKMWKIRGKEERVKIRLGGRRVVLCRKANAFECYPEPRGSEVTQWTNWLMHIRQEAKGGGRAGKLWADLEHGQGTISLYDFAIRAPNPRLSFLQLHQQKL